MTTWTVLGSVTLPAVPRSVPAARRFAAGLLPPGDLADILVLLVSEAATNSVRHSDSRHGGELTLTLYDVGGAVRVDVADAGGATAPERVSRGALATGGRGMAMIEDLADRAGHHGDDAGRRHTWFEIAFAA
ncbi:ATP-binding protein [Actinomadura parmotrematis]|uniref:ATP-binding protein n=1 Tax=Actinomadura parmotrematis TaxID=2864039 RepID=A0ABS7FT55_9ACTN|nr:ATP-binding protein [Actinomadura parmotrematis]MBW8483496.1 ATP-binding protein [Actinomadura parmotrematis]